MTVVSRLSTVKTIRNLTGVYLLIAALAASAAGFDDRNNDTAPALAISTFEISDQDAQAITFNVNSNHIWIYSKQRLQAFYPNGNIVVDRLHPQLPAGSAQAELLAEGEQLWLAIGHVLYQFDKSGSLVGQRGFHRKIDALDYDVKRGQLLVATEDYVIVLDLNGQEIERVKVRLANIA